MSSCNTRQPGAETRRLPAAAGVLAALLLAACGEVPKPFSHDGTVTNPMVRPGSRAGIAVPPVAGMERGPALAEAVAAALRRRDLAAHSRASAGSGYVVKGRLRRASGPGRGPREIRIVWTVADPGGRPAGVYLQEDEVTEFAWGRGDPALLARLAEDAVAGVLPFIAEGEAPAAAARPQIAVLDVAGAPGDGRISLRRAVAFELGKAGFTVSESGIETDRALVLAGSVATRPAGPGQENVEIIWTLMAPDGEVLGQLNQASRVATGRLARHWGTTAVLVARAAAPGLARLIERAAARRAGGERSSARGAPRVP